MTYDSAPETQAHIEDVRVNITHVISDLQDRAFNHDASKLESPEKEMFDEFTPKLAESEYGSDEYKANLKEMGPALQHHYEQNRHHPEHWINGILDMNLIDIIEMLCDWRASILRRDRTMGSEALNQALLAGISYNASRFEIPDELAVIMASTAEYLWGPIEEGGGP